MKYSPEIIKEIHDNLELGLTITDVCDLVGISRETFYEWRDDPSKIDITDESVKKAELACKRRNIGIIQNAARRSWQAAAWWLERKFSDEYATKQKHEISGDKDNPLVFKNLNDDEITKRIAKVEAGIIALKGGAVEEGQKKEMPNRPDIFNGEHPGVSENGKDSPDSGAVPESGNSENQESNTTATEKPPQNNGGDNQLDNSAAVNQPQP